VKKNYKRADNIDELIHSVKLPYLAWKVLFLIDEQMETTKISEILEESEQSVADALVLLENEKLIGAKDIEEIAEPKKEAEKKPEVVEEPVVEEEKPEEKPPELIADIEDDSPDILEADLLSTELEENIDVEPEPEPEPEPEQKVDLDEEKVPEIKIDGEPESETTGSSEEEVPSVELEENDDSEDETLDLGIDLEPAKEQKPAKPVKEEKQGPVSGQPTILVIDDSIVIRKMVEIALEDANFHIESAVNGKSGLELVDSVNPKLVIVDLMLPDINGIDILKTIKASKGIPVIMLSGKDTPQMIEKAKAEGADEFLPKPFKDEELVEKINSLLK